MKRPLYYLRCAIACASMVSSTMPMTAIAEAVQPQAAAGWQAQAAYDTNLRTNCRHERFRLRQPLSSETDLAILCII